MKNKNILIIVSVVIVAGLAFWLMRKPVENSQAPTSQTNTEEQTQTPTGTTQGSTPKNTTSGSTAPKQKSSGISITAPLGGAKWVLATQNIISWNKEAGYSGGIELLDASTKQIVGWITPSLGVHQTSYAWNTSDVALSRTNPSKKNISAGNYIIKVIFDGPISSIESASFSVVPVDQVVLPTHTITMQNYTFNPASITVKRGEKFIFVNQNQVAVNLKLSISYPFPSIAAGDSFTFDTKVLVPGQYQLYSETYQGFTFNFVVQ